MGSDYDYKDLLERAFSKLPKVATEHERFQVPEANVFVEGNTTLLRNFTDICDAINRQPDQVIAFLLRELGTAGSLNGKRAIFKGKLSPSLINDRLNSYIQGYVLCSECKKPDTRLVKEGRTPVLECDACGAHRPLRVRKGPKSQETSADAVSEGNVLEVMIQDVGRKGDGIAKRGKYVIYIPGTAKGSIVKVKIEKVSGTVAFGKVVRD